MASGKGNYLSGKLLDYVLSVASFTPAATVYVALYTVMPSGSGGGTEVTGGSYARVAVTNNATNWPAQTAQTKNNGAVIDFGTATADWGTIVGAAIWDASSSGNLYYWGPLTVSRTVLNGDSFKIPVNGATITES